MSEMNGYIKIHRKITEWGWYKDPNTKAVFLHLLLTANYREREYMGMKILPGQCIIGRLELAKTLGLTERSVRTALQHLKSTNEVTIKTTNRFSVVTIVNWEKYQMDDCKTTSKTTSKVTNKRPANDQQTTTPKERKERKESKEYREAAKAAVDGEEAEANIRKLKQITKRTFEKEDQQ